MKRLEDRRWGLRAGAVHRRQRVGRGRSANPQSQTGKTVLHFPAVGWVVAPAARQEARFRRQGSFRAGARRELAQGCRRPAWTGANAVWKSFVSAFSGSFLPTTDEVKARIDISEGGGNH